MQILNDFLSVAHYVRFELDEQSLINRLGENGYVYKKEQNQFRHE